MSAFAPPRLPVLVLRLAAILAVGACGRSGAWLPDGAIEVHNSPFSFGFGDAVRVVEVFGGAPWFLETCLVPGEALLVDRLRPGLDGVTVHGSDGSRDTFLDVDVDPGRITLLEVEN